MTNAALIRVCRIAPDLGVTEHGRPVEIEPDGTIVGLHPDPAYPLAHRAGVVALQSLVHLDDLWSELTKPQRRCLLDPSTRTARPWRALTEKGYVAGDELTEPGQALAWFAAWWENKETPNA